MEVLAFTEKPDRGTAEIFVLEGYLWNSGNFLFRADVMLAEIGEYEPDILAAARASLNNSKEDLGALRLGADDFQRSPAKSIDYAVMERTKVAAVLPVSFAWSDIGGWNAVWDLSQKDPNGNASRGPSVTVGSRNVYINSDEHIMTSVVGLDDIAVISTVDAVLVVARDRADQVKELVEDLRGRNCEQASIHKRSYRPWGYYQSVDYGARFQVKRIVVNPGQQLSLQKHFHRSEHWVVVQGTAEVTIDARVTIIKENESVYVPLGCVHRLGNPGKIPLELIEVQVGSYLREDDIVRLEDVYNRLRSAEEDG
jgi:mannose-1-phosphate guanylyltransferase/mannose-6-phosphate isomerase